MRAIGTLMFCVLVASAGLAEAQTHVVREGQSLARIARRYHVTVQDLAAANGLTVTSHVHVGQELRIPESGVAYVRAGQTLSEIARDAHCTVAELRRLNRLAEGASLHVGQRLVLPGYEAPRGGAHGAAPRWGRPRTAGTATFYRLATHTRSRVRLMDRRGRAPRSAMRQLGLLMRPRGARPRERFPNPPARLIELLARVSDHFGGRVIQIVSGYRHAGGYTRDSSQHTHGHALDMRVEGVPNTALRDYLRTLDRVGVGYYPRSTFVHFDVRDRSAYWVDWSRAGEAPRYQRRGEAPPDDATTEEREDTPDGGDDVGDEGGEGGVEADEGGEAESPEPAEPAAPAELASGPRRSEVDRIGGGAPSPEARRGENTGRISSSRDAAGGDTSASSRSTHFFPRASGSSVRGRARPRPGTGPRATGRTRRSR